MTDKQCSQCGAWSDENALRCTCGYEFAAEQVEATDVKADTGAVQTQNRESKGKGFAKGFIAGFVCGSVMGFLSVFTSMYQPLLVVGILIVVTFICGYLLYRIIYKRLLKRAVQAIGFSDTGLLTGIFSGIVFAYAIDCCYINIALSFIN